MAITVLNERVSRKCEFLAQVRIGLLLVDVYSWGQKVVNGRHKNVVLHLTDGICKDNLCRMFPQGQQDFSRRLAAEIAKAIIMAKEQKESIDGTHLCLGEGNHQIPHLRDLHSRGSDL
jgi:hypothetical protein